MINDAAITTINMNTELKYVEKLLIERFSTE